jgi:hypothetical protein
MFFILGLDTAYIMESDQVLSDEVLDPCTSKDRLEYITDKTVKDMVNLKDDRTIGHPFAAYFYMCAKADFKADTFFD